MTAVVTELPPSKLGTKEHWDDVYHEEISNFIDHGDEGEVWFGEDTQEKMVEWALANVPPSPDLSVLEIGSGNGALLFGLLDAGYPARCLAGLDYSSSATQLAEIVAVLRDGEKISFTTSNFLEDDPLPLPNSVSPSGGVDRWDLLLDKGTYDAIALGVKDEHGRSPAINYPSRVARLLKPGGYFLITSCNFTEDELKANFVTSETGLVYHSRIQHPTYSFGGKSGSTCASIAVQKPLPAA
ncbi:S-adenosyl-L-methionine-dependent methyltransferase [Pluteus cervinus]|uniref:S-adenosyl-L-methionine-dependent methyltransferase n=1 Tax=Pluteus cervinus TaxID=181527 RepID=A0ACD3AX13_9AGAR|nr:S-adenosyl-L-methionine-dependent methyltransferase [Pluteus cervinus]